MAFDALIAMKKTSKKPKEGDIFVLQPSNGIFYFGKVIETEVKSIDSFVNGMTLIYVYQYWSYEKTIPQELDTKKFLIAPAVVNYQPWRKGYFETIGNVQVTQNEKNAEFGFWHVLKKKYVDISGQEIKNKPSIYGIFGLASYGAIGKEVQKAIRCFEKNMLESYIVNFKNSVNKFKELQREKYPAVTEENDNGEWEPGYIEFDDMCGAYLKLIENIDYDNNKNNLLDDMLYAIARDNECEFLISETLEHPDWFLALCKYCISSEYNNAKWQFASYLPEYKDKTDIKNLIFKFLDCGNEYTERMALRSLAEIEPDSVEKYAEIFWNRNKYEADEYQKMMVLEVLEKIKSSKLNEYIAKAMKMNYEYLRKQADDIKNRLQ